MGGRMARAGRERLGEAEWVAAATRLLADQGVDAVRVEPLSAALGVTKGSFYWHFAHRRALLDAVLDAWERRATSAVIDAVETASGAPSGRLSRLVALIGRSRRAPSVEHAIRAWGALDPRARAVLARVDARREAYVRGLLRALGLPPAAARTRSHLAYLMMIGEFTWVAHGGAPAGPGPWRELVRLLLAGSGAAARAT